jgi:hypothetical protein
MNTGEGRRFEEVDPTTIVGNLGPEKEGEETGRLGMTLVRLSVGGREA